MSTQQQHEPKWRPILMQKPLVIQASTGWKTNTRRIMKNSAAKLFRYYHEHQHPLGYKSTLEIPGSNWCPYGYAGDFLYARETIWTHKDDGHITYEKPAPEFAPEYKATPSIHMPKKHARLFMEITAVHAENLFDISETDAIAEGIDFNEYCLYKNYHNGKFELSPIESYFTLWETINGKLDRSTPIPVWSIHFKLTHQRPAI